MPNKQLVEKRAELDAKRGILAKVFAQARTDTGEHDLSKVTRFGEEDVSKLTPTKKAEKIAKANEELNDLGAEVEKLAKVDLAYTDQKRREFNAQARGVEPGSGEKPASKSLGQLIVESGIIKRALESGQAGIQTVIGEESVSFSAAAEASRKAVFQTTAGWPPETTRIGRLVEMEFRPVQILDLIPPGTTGQASIVYMAQTTRTMAAAERAENAAYPESEFALEERTGPVRSIGHRLPVTDEQMADVAGLQSYLDNLMIAGCNERLDGQLLNGDGTSPNLEGILNTTDIQTVAKTEDVNAFDTVYTALTNVRVTGRAMPNRVFMHPKDWQDIRTAKDADGNYLYGPPQDAGPMRIWGIPITETDHLAEGTALVADLMKCQLFERMGIEVEIGYVSDDFSHGRRTIRAGRRVAFVVYRPKSFCTVTGL